MRQLFEEQADRIAGIMKDSTGYAFSFSFTRSMGLSAADIYNWDAGNIAVAEDVAKAREDTIQTEALYKIARGYIEVMAEIF